MGVEMLDQTKENLIADESFLNSLDHPLNGTDARRRLEDKLEEQRLKRELKEFDFDY